MAFSPYGRRIMLGATFGLNAAPTTCYLALSPSIPTAASTTEFLVEPAVAEYARVAYGFGPTYWVFHGWSELGNAQPVRFPTPTSDWGMVRGWALVSGLGAANIYASGPLRQPRRASAGTSLLMAIGALRLSLR